MSGLLHHIRVQPDKILYGAIVDRALLSMRRVFELVNKYELESIS